MDKQKLTYEQFKEDILQWKNTHREEYNRFARLMTNGDEKQYLSICRAIFKQLPKVKTEWELCWDDDNKDDFNDIDLLFNEGAVPEQIVEAYQKQRDENKSSDKTDTRFWDKVKSFFRGTSEKHGVVLSAPLVLSWLYYGKSFEAMVGMVSRQARNPKADNADRQSCSFVARQIISVSIKNGFRTQADWDRYFAMNNAIENGHIGEWALQSVADDMTGETEPSKHTGTNQSVTGSVNESTATNDVPKSRGRQKAKEIPLIDYFDCDNKEAVIGVIWKFISKYDTAAEQALTYYALNELGLLSDIASAKEFAAALIRQFEGMGSMKSESSYRQAIHMLTTTQHVMKDGVNRMCVMLNGDTCQTLLAELKADLTEAVNGTIYPTPDEPPEMG